MFPDRGGGAFDRLERGDGVHDRSAARGPARRELGEAFRLAPQRIELRHLTLRWIENVATDGVPRPEDLDPDHVTAGVVPTEGHEAARAPGQLGQRLGAVDVGRHLGVGARSGEAIAGDRIDLLAAEPAHLVELVHAHVDEDPAAVCPEGRGRRLSSHW